MIGWREVPGGYGIKIYEELSLENAYNPIDFIGKTYNEDNRRPMSLESCVPVAKAAKPTNDKLLLKVRACKQEYLLPR